MKKLCVLGPQNLGWSGGGGWGLGPPGCAPQIVAEKSLGGTKENEAIL